MPTVSFAPTRRASLFERLIGVALAAALSALLSLVGWPASAALVDASRQEFGYPVVVPRPDDRAANEGVWQDLSTGSHYVDLLFQRQGAATESFREASSRATGLAGLSLPQHTRPALEPMNEAVPALGDSPLLRSVEPMGDVADQPSDGSAPPDSVARRGWAQSLGRHDAALSGDATAAESGFDHRDDEPGTLRATQQAIEWLRKHRWQLLAALAGVAVVVGLLKAYSRRPTR